MRFQLLSLFGFLSAFFTFVAADSLRYLETVDPLDSMYIVELQTCVGHNFIIRFPPFDSITLIFGQERLWKRNSNVSI